MAYDSAAKELLDSLFVGTYPVVLRRPNEAVQAVARAASVVTATARRASMAVRGSVQRGTVSRAGGFEVVDTSGVQTTLVVIAGQPDVSSAESGDALYQ